MRLLSRVADNMLWLNRYVERASCLVRVLRNSYILSFDLGLSKSKSFDAANDIFYSGFLSEDTEIGTLLNTFITDNYNPNSVRVLLGKARENARASQDKISKEVWEQLNSLYHYINSPAVIEQLKNGEAMKVLDYLHNQFFLYYGVLDTTMARGEAWEFLNTGKYIERSILTIDITEWYLKDLNYDLNEGNVVYWRPMLLALTGYEQYLKGIKHTPHTPQIIDFVLFNKYFNHSLIYSVTRLHRYSKNIILQNSSVQGQSVVKQVERLKSNIEFYDNSKLCGETVTELLNNARKQIWNYYDDFYKLILGY
ncbi:alpha-E domain-containing protein [Polluticaenibacter yanchengensis]|uniref:Alpha-E domain-containing protein n=1 Tax=Polluticaenibacter yanchengensis TaxID=3014562 RepID=A0ABT4ULP7_9BACT|nr:alpha-E domain-containing protein [Chitinophagaceae bacterium LY-5]